MTENAFTQAEAALVDDIVREVTRYGHPAESTLGLACFGVLSYAQPEDQEAAAQAVIQLVKERLNIQPENCGNCRTCLKVKKTENGWPVLASMMILCPMCGNKRCPKATNHTLDCTGSNEAGQSGSDYVV